MILWIKNRENYIVFIFLKHYHIIDTNIAISYKKIYI